MHWYQLARLEYISLSKLYGSSTIFFMLKKICYVDIVGGKGCFCTALIAVATVRK